MSIKSANQFVVGVLLIFFSSTLSCTTNSNSPHEESSLPYLGRHEYVEKTVDNTILVDTLYHQVADFSFVDQDSTIITASTFDDKIYVTDFFFTSCPTICPVMKTQMLRVYNTYKDNKEVALLSHTIDPEYDTVALLHDYAERLGVASDSWHFVTGDKDKIYEMGLKSYMVTALEDEEEPGGFLHSGAFILVDKNKHIRGMYDGTKKDQVDLLINDIDKLLQENSSSKKAI